jgi:hypothetical protein
MNGDLSDCQVHKDSAPVGKRITAAAAQFSINMMSSETVKSFSQDDQHLSPNSFLISGTMISH